MPITTLSLIILIPVIILTFYIAYNHIINQVHIDNRIRKIRKSAYKTAIYTENNDSDSNWVEYLKNIDTRLSATFSGFTRDALAANRLKFEQAGLDPTYAPAITFLCRLVCMISFLIIYTALLFYTYLSKANIALQIGLFILFLFISFRLFEYILDYKIRRRYKRIKKSIAFSVDMLAICTRSSLSLDQAFDKISEEMSLFNPDLAEEFMKVATELTIIPDRSQAIRNLARRVDLPLVHLLTSGLVHALEHGVSLTQTLTALSQEFSKHRLIAVEEKAARLPVLLTIPLALFCLPATMIILVGPVAATLRSIPLFN